MNLERFIDQAFPSKELFLKRINSGKKLRIYIGIDPTGSELHLGHSIGLIFLRQMQKMGHKVIVLAGDFTARIGDPSGKTSKRIPLSKAQVSANLKNYKRQIGRIIDFKSQQNPAIFAHNSKWLGKLRLDDFVDLLANFTVGQILERDLFQERIRQGKPISLLEFLYPIFQGFDSVMLDVDVEVGGSDQIFNMLTGRDLLKSYKNKEKFVVSVKLLQDPNTGKKMSKSEGFYVSLNQKPNNLFGSIMSLPDGFIKPCLELCTVLDDSEITEILKMPARAAKEKLALEITRFYHSEKQAQAAKDFFYQAFVEKKAPQAEIIAIKSGKYKLLELVFNSGLVGSKSEARRLISQRAVEINGEPKINPDEEINVLSKLDFKIGKRRFFQIKPSN